jgi:hypothetical protein
VVSTLINNWYSWADYYVNNVDAVDVPNVTGTTYGNLGQILHITPTNGGHGYTSAPIVTIIGGGGTGATAEAIINDKGQVVGFNITSPGAGYIEPPRILISGGGGIGATATATYSTSLTLDGINPAQGKLLRVGDVVSGPNIDPKSRTTIAAISADFTTVTLSNPVHSAVKNGSYSFSKPVPIPRSTDDTHPYKLTFDSNYKPQPGQDPLAFARSIYDVMQGFSHLSERTYLSQSALLLQYVISCNIGTFALQAGQELPVERVNQLRDELKSILRGVSDFAEFQEFNPDTGAHQWYPDPSKATPGVLIDKGSSPQPATFGVFNLNPYVWFIHVKLGMSGYGFSVDDDTANAQDAASSIQVAFGGTAATAPGAAPAQKLVNPELYTFGAPFGTLHDQGHIDTTSGVAKGYDLTKYTVINGLSLVTVGKLKAFDAKNGQGALVTGAGMTPGSSRVYFVGPANPNPNTPDGANASYVVLAQPSPAQDGPTATYTFSGFTTTLPVIASSSLASGAVGSSVTLTGSGFTKALGVTFNGIPATTFKVNDDTSITVTVPAGATSGRIGVRGPAGTGYSTSDFTVTTNTASTGLSAQERFVQALYLDELGRAGSQAELDGWVNGALEAPGGSQQAVAAGIADSPEARDHLVKTWYQTYLGRTANGTEEQGWVNALASQSEEQVLSGILASPEFYDRAQTLGFGDRADGNYLRALYQVLLNRTASSAEVAGWVNALPELGTQGVALGFLQSQEFRTDQVEGYYNALLHRPADPAGLNNWVMSNLDMHTVRLGFEASPEFFANG